MDDPRITPLVIAANRELLGTDTYSNDLGGLFWCRFRQAETPVSNQAVEFPLQLPRFEWQTLRDNGVIAPKSDRLQDVDNALAEHFNQTAEAAGVAGVISFQVTGCYFSSRNSMPREWDRISIVVQTDEADLVANKEKYQRFLVNVLDVMEAQHCIVQYRPRLYEFMQREEADHQALISGGATPQQLAAHNHSDIWARMVAIPELATETLSFERLQVQLSLGPTLKELQTGGCTDAERALYAKTLEQTLNYLPIMRQSRMLLAPSAPVPDCMFLPPGLTI